MRWLSKGVEELIADECGASNKNKVHDAIIVGSGYGGAVSALRLAEAGAGVLVLERGEEWLSGEFPNDIGNAFSELRVERATASNMTGNAAGLYNFHLDHGIGALVGNGLGGTSLINAGVVMEPDWRVFDKLIPEGHDGKGEAAWPAALRTIDGKPEPSLARAYETARAALRAESFTGVWVDGPVDPDGNIPSLQVLPEKHERLRELESEIARTVGHEAKVSFVPVDLTIALGIQGDPDAHRVPFLDSCIGCGECVTGCNQNAKKSLNNTYLARAREAGASMVTGVTVMRVERRADGVWAVHFVRTAWRARQLDGVASQTHTLYARRVVLSAGTFGSCEILQRSQQPDPALPDQPGLALSKQLGRRVSTNGDTLAFGYMLDKQVNGVARSTRAPYDRSGIGPTITGAIRVDHPTDVRHSVLVEEGVVPGAIAGLFHEMVSASATFAQLDNWFFKRDGGQTLGGDWAVAQRGALTHTQTLLAMGHDDSLATIEYDPVGDRIAAHYDAIEPEGVYRRQDKVMREIAKQGAIYLQNPALSPLPDKLRRTLDTPVPGNAAFTVHPLGGCVMADSAANGVVDDCGRVFDTGKGKGKGKGNVYAGLYVLDGSIVATSLGANPLLTITALAERAMVSIVQEFKAGKSNTIRPQKITLSPSGSIASDLPAYLPHGDELKVHFSEAMRGTLRFEGQERKAHLVLHLPIDDLALFWADPQHQIALANQFDLKKDDLVQLDAHLRLDVEDARGQVVATRILRVVSGRISILPVVRPGLIAAASRGTRTVLTWWQERGRDEVWRGVAKRLRSVVTGPDSREEVEPRAGVLERVVGFAKMTVHASEARTMEYRLELCDTERSGYQQGRTYTLIGVKEVGYAAQWMPLLRRAVGLDAYLDRTNVWMALGALRTRLLDAAGKEVGSGDLNLDMLDMTRMHAPQIGLQRDTPNSLLGLAGYPLWFMRLMVKTRLWDFPAPDYPTTVPLELDGKEPPLPTVDQDADLDASHEAQQRRWPKLPALRVFPDPARSLMATIEAEPPIAFAVQRSRSSSDKDVLLRLTRYKHRDGLTSAEQTSEETIRVKAMLLLNGFAQSTFGFVPQEHNRAWPPRTEAGPNFEDELGLAEFFYEQGYDVWLFDYRTSSILDASKRACSMDDIAEFDIPAAVDEVLKRLRTELRLQADARLQIYAFAHCVGAASLAMSLLGGYLQYGKSKTSKLAGVTFSQMQMFLIGGQTAQLRLQVGGLLRDTLGVEYLRLSAAECQATPFEALLDRFFASLPVDPGEHCPFENDKRKDQPGICTCKRMSGSISRLLKHDRLKPRSPDGKEPGTHDRLPVYFGRANTSLLVHGGRCVENERLVNADGQNVYVTDDNIIKFLRMPVAILHGKHNALFNVESAVRTFEQLSRINPELTAARLYRRIIATDYAHFDCTIGYGKSMHVQILEKLRKFYADAWLAQIPVKLLAKGEQPMSVSLKPPLCGPVIGWSRTVLQDGVASRIVRVWIEVDETESVEASGAVTIVRQKNGHFFRAQLWPVVRVPLSGSEKTGDPKFLSNAKLATDVPRVSIALADLVLPVQEGADDYRVKMFSVHALPSVPTRDSRAARAASRAGLAIPQMRPMLYRPTIFAGADAVQPHDPGQRQDAGMVFSSGLGDHNVTTRLFERMSGLSGDTGGSPSLSVEAAAIEQAYLRQLWEGHIEWPKDVARAIAAQWWSELNKDSRDRTEGALRAKPATLSRKRRKLDPPYSFPWTATIHAPQLQPMAQSQGLRFIAGCCRYPGLGFEDKRADASFERIAELLQSDAQTHRDFMFMLGDQIYADASAGLLDSPSPIEKITLRNRRAFATTGFNRVTAQLATYMVIDDHEIGDNWTRDDLLSTKPAVRRQARTLFDAGLASFAAYQWAHSPRNQVAPGFNYSLQEKGFDFFVLDTRTQRRRFGALPKICTKQQLDCLEDWLKNLPKDSRPKFIVSGSVLAPGLRKWDQPHGRSDPMAESWQMAQEQRRKVLKMLIDHRIRNAVFLSGDYHCSATATLDLGDKRRAYAIVAPPLYAPLPGINVKPEDVMPLETVTVGGKPVVIKAKPRRGSGFADIQIDASAGGGWRMAIFWHLFDLDDKDPRFGVDTEHILLE